MMQEHANERPCVKIEITGLAYEDIISIIVSNGYDVACFTKASKENTSIISHKILVWKGDNE